MKKSVPIHRCSFSGGLLRSLAEGLAFFRAVNAVEHEDRTQFLDRLTLLFVHSIPERLPLLFLRLWIAGPHRLYLYSLVVSYLKDTVVGPIHNSHVSLAVSAAQFIDASRQLPDTKRDQIKKEVNR